MKTHHSNPKLASVSLAVFLSAFSFFISPADANAQFGIRVDAGVSRYAATNLSDVSVANYFGPGIQAGVNYDIHVKGKFFITPALTWSMRSETARDPSTLAKETVHEHFLNLPVHVKWIFEIKPEKFAIYCYGGPVFSYGLSSRASVETFVNSRFFDATYDYYSGKADVDFSPLNVDATTEAELDAMLQAAADEEGLLRTRFEARFDAGVGFRFADHYELILGSDFGMTNRNKGTLSTAVTLMTSYISDSLTVSGTAADLRWRHASAFHLLAGALDTYRYSNHTGIERNTQIQKNQIQGNVHRTFRTEKQIRT